MAGDDGVVRRLTIPRFSNDRYVDRNDSVDVRHIKMICILISRTALMRAGHAF